MKYPTQPPKKLTAEDKEFIKRIDKGEKKSPAFRAAYPNHPATVQFYTSESGTPERQEAVEKLVDAAKAKLRTKYISGALTTYQDKMEEFSTASIHTAIDLVKNARSEKVRADLAIEGLRHKVGTPTQKVAVKEERIVTLKFGEPPEKKIIEGEIVDDAP